MLSLSSTLSTLESDHSLAVTYCMSTGSLLCEPASQLLVELFHAIYQRCSGRFADRPLLHGDSNRECSRSLLETSLHHGTTGRKAQLSHIQEIEGKRERERERQRETERERERERDRERSRKHRTQANKSTPQCTSACFLQEYTPR